MQQVDRLRASEQSSEAIDNSSASTASDVRNRLSTSPDAEVERPVQRGKPIAILRVPNQSISIQVDNSGNLHLVPIAVDDPSFVNLPAAVIAEPPFPKDQSPNIYLMGLGAVEVGTHTSFVKPHKLSVALMLQKAGESTDQYIPLSDEELLDLFIPQQERVNRDTYDQASFYVLHTAGYDDLLCILLHDSIHPAFIIVGPQPNGKSHEEIGAKNVTIQFLRTFARDLAKHSYITEHVNQVITRALQEGLIIPEDTNSSAANAGHLEMLVLLYKIKSLMLAHAATDINDKALGLVVPFLDYYSYTPFKQKAIEILVGKPQVRLTNQLLIDLIQTETSPSLPKPPVRATVYNDKPQIASRKPVVPVGANAVLAPQTVPERLTPHFTVRDTKPAIAHPARTKWDGPLQSPAEQSDRRMFDIQKQIINFNEGPRGSEYTNAREIRDQLKQIIPVILKLFPPDIEPETAEKNYQLLQLANRRIAELVDQHTELLQPANWMDTHHLDTTNLIQESNNVSVFGLSGPQLIDAFQNDRSTTTQYPSYILAIKHKCSEGSVSEARLDQQISPLSIAEIVQQAQYGTKRASANNFFAMRRLVTSEGFSTIAKNNDRLRATLVADVTLRSQLLLTLLTVMRHESGPVASFLMKLVSESLTRIATIDKQQSARV